MIHPEMPLDIEVLDLRSLPEPERLPKAGQIAREKSETPFDLQRGPLSRKPAAAGSALSLARCGDAPHHFRRMVRGNPGPRAGRFIQRIRAGPAFACRICRSNTLTTQPGSRSN